MIILAPYNGSSNQTYNGVISGSGGLIQRGAGNTILNGANTYTGGTRPSAGAIGFGIDNAIGTGPLWIAPEDGDITGSGAVFAFGGARTITNSIQYPSGTNNLTLVLGGTNNLTFSGPFTLNGNDGSNTYTIRPLQVTNTAQTTFSGVISDLTNGVSAVCGLTITGNGTNASGPLILSNTETYTGPTTITNSTLQVNGQLAAASGVTVNSNATLAGIGTINGPVAINSGVLAPGAASIGTLTLNSNLTLAGNVNVRVNRSPLTNDNAVVSGTLTNAGTGTVTVTNLGSALQGGDTFTLFNKALANGSALTVVGAGVTWSNALALNGTISVAPTVIIPTISPAITNFSLANGNQNVVINGTNGQSGGTYYLLTSTNVATPLSQWTAVATNVVSTSGASAAFTFIGTNAVTSGVKQQFFILSSTNN